MLQLRFLDDSGLGEPIFQLLKHLQKISFLSMEYVCSQAIPRSGSSYKWELVGAENELVTDVLKLRGVLTKSSK